MKELWQEWKSFMRQKFYVTAVSLTALLAYGYLWMHPAINVDDTSMVRYFYDGLAPQVGRWTLFLLNKVFKIAQFNPFVTDFLGVVLMVAGATVFCVLLKKVSGNRLDPMVYPAFTCLMISYPMISEVYTYYLHNGIGLAYLLTALALYVVIEGKTRKRLLGAGVLLALAISCYESFAAVYLLGIFVVMFVYQAIAEKKMKFGEYVLLILQQVIPLVIGMLLRTVICRVLLSVLGLEPVMRSIGGAIRWIFSGHAADTLMTMVKTFARYYILNAIVNPAILIFVITTVLLIVFTIIYAVKTGKKMILLTGLALLVTPWLISFLEGSVAIYRSMQVLPIYAAFAMSLLINALLHRKRGWGRVAAGVLTVVVLYNQVFEMNHWFYVDYLRYQEDVRRCDGIALDIEREASLDKPVVFLGKTRQSGVADKYAYVEQDSRAYQILAKADHVFGGGSEEKQKQYAIVQNMVWYPMFDWGVDAFGEPGTELIEFFNMNGYPLEAPEPEMKEEAERYRSDMAVWPKDGSILETERYIVVKLGE